MNRTWTTLIAIAASAALAGCASLTNAGHTEYEVKHTADGKGCDLKATDGKEYKPGRAIQFDGKACQLVVDEGASKAVRSQGVAAKALSLWPLGDLGKLLGESE